MKKKCRRKVWVLVNPIAHAIEGVSITPSSILDRLRMVELSALESFTTGRATLSDWLALAGMLNVAETMADGGIGPEALEACTRAQDGLSEAKDRFNRIGKLGLSGAAIQAVRDVYAYHDLQRQAICRSEYEGWIRKTQSRVALMCRGLAESTH